MSEFGGGVTFGAVKPNENEIYSSPIEDEGSTFKDAGFTQEEDAGVTFGNAAGSTFEDAGFTQEEDAGVTQEEDAGEAPKYSMEEENQGDDPLSHLTPEELLELYKEYMRQQQENGGSARDKFGSFTDWLNSDPAKDFRTRGQPDFTPIDAEELAQIKYLESKREEYGYSVEEWYGEGRAYDQTLWKPKEYAADTEYAQELIKKVKDEHAANKEQIAKALGNAAEKQGADWGAWGETLLDVIGKAADYVQDAIENPKLPGITITHSGDEGVYATILIPIPGLPPWVQGDGLKIPVAKDGRFVLGDSIWEQINKIGEKIRGLPENISEGIENVIKEVSETGERVKRIWTDGKGNILADIVNTAGELSEVLTLPVSIFAGGEHDQSIIDFLLKAGLLTEALEWLKRKFEEGGEGVDPNVETPIVIPVVPEGDVTFGDPSKRPLTGGVTFGENKQDDPPITGGATFGENTKGEDPITGGATFGESIKGGATFGENTRGKNPITGGATFGENTRSIEGGGSTPSDIVTSGTNVSDTFTSGGGGGGGGNPFMGAPLRRQRPPVEEEEDPFDPFYFGDFENIYDPVAIVMNPKAREQFGGVGIASLAVRDLVISGKNLDRIQEQAENIGTPQNKKPANVEDMRAASAARGGLVRPSFPDKLQRIMRYAI